MALVEDRQARGLHGRDLATDIPEALHIGFEFAFAAAGVADFSVSGRIHRSAHQGQGFVDRYLMGGHTGVGDEKRSGGKSSNSAPDDVGALVLYAFRGKLIDAIVVSHVRSLLEFKIRLPSANI